MKASEVSTSYEYPIINTEEATYRFQGAELKPDNGGDSSFIIFKWEAVAPEFIGEGDDKIPFAGNVEASFALYITKNGKSKFDEKKQDGGAKWLKNLDEKLGLTSNWDTSALTQADFDSYRGRAVTGPISTKVTEKDGQTRTNYKLGWVKAAATQYNQ